MRRVAEAWDSMRGVAGAWACMRASQGRGRVCTDRSTDRKPLAPFRPAKGKATAITDHLFNIILINAVINAVINALINAIQWQAVSTEEGEMPWPKGISRQSTVVRHPDLERRYAMACAAFQVRPPSK